MHNRQHIADMPAILRQRGIRHVIISPGSRNAPLIDAFYREFGHACISIVDERSAAYAGLGIATYSGMPVALICTSGTAALNYSPAVAEAFHQGIPLLAITADRPPEWIDQQDNQTIRQPGIFAPNCKASFVFPVEIRSAVELRHAHRMVNEAFNMTMIHRKGPVHFNVPLREPLYEHLPDPGEVTCMEMTESRNFEDPGGYCTKAWRHARRILLVAGQQRYDHRLGHLLGQVLLDKRVCLIGEPLSNIKTAGVLENPEWILAVKKDQHDLAPDLLVYFGGQVVSTRLKHFLRNCRSEHAWYIDPAGRHVDTFLQLSRVVMTDPIQFFKRMTEGSVNQQSGYQKSWHDLADKTNTLLRAASAKIEYSDLGIMQRLSEALPDDSLLFAGNSSIIRYLSCFRPHCHEVFSNRGTSGIDGCLSTATGIAMVADRTVIALIGDQSFVYDSNALWNRALPDNLKIIVINNQGGGIFGIIDGPSDSPAYKPFFEAHHPADFARLSAAFHVSHHTSGSFGEFDDAFRPFLKQKGPAVFEIVTPNDINPSVFRTFVDQLTKSV